MTMNECVRCGACCAWFRVDFSVYELDGAGGSVPETLAIAVNGTTVRMRGTDHWPPRCAALCGTLGQQVHCAIYEWRPNPCREFAEGSAACAEARRRHGLPPLA